MELQQLYELARSLWVVWLIILFGVVVWWAYRPKNRRRFEDAAQIPFKDGNKDE